MDKGFAILVLNACFRASRELGELAPMLKTFAAEGEGAQLKPQIGMAVADIGQITESIYKMYPDLYGYVEEQIEKYGRVS